MELLRTLRLKSPRWGAEFAAPSHHLLRPAPSWCKMPMVFSLHLDASGSDVMVEESSIGSIDACHCS